LVSKFEKLEAKTKQDQIAKDTYSKRFNLLIHGLKENKDKAWETREEMEEIFLKFLTEGLGLSRNDITLADIHRLSKQPVYSNNIKVDRPIIFKLTNAFDNNKIKNCRKLLKKFNEKQNNRSSAPSYVYVSDHLPKEPLIYKKAREENKQATLSVQNGQYCWYVQGIKTVALTNT